MKRDYYDRGSESGMMASFGALVMGVILGAAATFFSDPRNRRKVNATLEDWKDKAEDVKEDIGDKAEDLRQKGLAKVSKELSKAQGEVKKRKE